MRQIHTFILSLLILICCFINTVEATKLGANTHMLYGQVLANSYSCFTDEWNCTTGRIDEAIRVLNLLGMSHIRELWNGDITLATADYLVAQCALHDIEVEFVTNELGSSTGFATQIATRYTSYSNISIDPFNEANAGWLTLSQVISAMGNYYDAVKAIAPNIKVGLPSMGYWQGGSFAYNAVSLLQSIHTNNLDSKFDYVNMHVYPYPNGIYSVDVAYIWPNPSTNGPSVITAVEDQLATMGRSDAKIAITEFGIFWNTYAGNQDISGQDIVGWYNWVKDRASIEKINYWFFWGSDRPDHSEWFQFNGAQGLFAMRGCGIVSEYQASTSNETHFAPYDYILGLGLATNAGIISLGSGGTIGIGSGGVMALQ